jgi:aspartate ammonia-lyase
LQDITGLGIARAENMVDVTQNADVFVETSGLLKAAAANFAKVAGDLKLLSSGPRGGIAEVALPRLQAGSSIMPAKVNPVIPEMAIQAAFQVFCFDQGVAMAAASGQLELNACLPLITYNLLSSLKLLTNTAVLLRTHCVEGITANEQNCRRWLEESLCLVTALVPYVGYDEAARIAGRAAQEGKTVRAAALELGLFSSEEIDIIFSTAELTRPGIAGERKLKPKKAEKDIW